MAGRSVRSLKRLASQTAQAVAALDDRVGIEVKQLRKARGLTISEVAMLTGLSVGYLSQIERGVSSPSVKALHGISRTLGVTVGWFFSPPTVDGDELRDHVVRAGTQRTIVFGSGIRDELLSPNLGRKLELLRCIFPPGASSSSEPYVHKGEEAGFVMKGQLHLWIGDKEIRLNEGDSFAFSSDEPHRYANPGDTETVVIWAITPPSY